MLLADFLFQVGWIYICLLTAKQGDNILGSVIPCVCPFVCTLTAQRFTVKFGAKNDQIV